jgi:hypothetical protein
MGRRETGVGELCAELGITRQTLYRHVDPEGRLRPDGERLLRYHHPGRASGLPAGAPRPDAGERHA